MFFNVGEWLLISGKYKVFEQMYRRVLELRGKVLGWEHPWALSSMNNLAAVLDGQDKYEEAEQMHQHTLEMNKKVLWSQPGVESG